MANQAGGADMTAELHVVGGGSRRLDVDAWTAPATAAELELLADVIGPVLDIGCGPGRLVAALVGRGVATLGVDSSPLAVQAARRRGAPALCRSVFERLPAEGRWRTILVLDGNIGIGGDAVRLLQRLSMLLAPGGTAFVEVGPPGSVTATTSAQVRVGHDRSPWFPWAFVAADDFDGLAARAGLERTGWHATDGRWIATVERIDR